MWKIIRCLMLFFFFLKLTVCKLKYTKKNKTKHNKEICCTLNFLANTSFCTLQFHRWVFTRMCKRMGNEVRGTYPKQKKDCTLRRWKEGMVTSFLLFCLLARFKFIKSTIEMFWITKKKKKINNPAYFV